MKSSRKSKVKQYYFQDNSQGRGWHTFSSTEQDELEALRNYLPSCPKKPAVALIRQYFLYREYLVAYPPDFGGLTTYEINRTILMSDKNSIEKMLDKAKMREFVEAGSNEA